MQDVEGCSRVPPVLCHKGGKGFGPVIQPGVIGPASNPMSVHRLNYMGPRELQRAVPLAEVPFILTRVAQSLPHEIAGTPSHQDPGNGLRRRVKRLEALLI